MAEPSRQSLSRRDFLRLSGKVLSAIAFLEFVPSPELERIGGELILHGSVPNPNIPGRTRSALVSVNLKTGGQTELSTLPTFVPEGGGTSLSPDRSRLVFQAVLPAGLGPFGWLIYNREAKDVERNAAGEIRVFDFRANKGIRWTPDGGSFVVSDGDHIKIVDVQTMEQRTLYETVQTGDIRFSSCRPGWPRQPVYSYEEREDILSPHKIWIVNEDLRSRREFLGLYPEWSPYGGVLAYIERHERLCLFAYKKKLSEGYKYFESNAFDHPISNPRWSPSGHYISFENAIGDVFIMDTWKYEVTRVFSGPGSSRGPSYPSYTWLEGDLLAITDVRADTGPGKPPQIFQFLKPSGEKVGRVEIPIVVEDDEGRENNMNIVGWGPTHYAVFLPLVMAGK